MGLFYLLHVIHVRIGFLLCLEQPLHLLGNRLPFRYIRYPETVSTKYSRSAKLDEPRRKKNIAAFIMYTSKTKLRGLSPRADYTNTAAAAGRRS